MTLYHGDCLDILPTLPAQSVDAVICDPPYGTTACKWDSVIPFEPMWRELRRIIKPRGAIVLFGSQPFTSALVMSWPQGFRHSWVWDKKQSGSPYNARYAPLEVTEDVMIFGAAGVKYYPQMRTGAMRKKGGAQKGFLQTAQFKGPTPISYSDQYYPVNILEFYNPKLDRAHETQKPVALMEYLIRTYTDEGDTVLDFTMGSGTTGVACVNTGRQFVGIERDAGYFEIARRRIEEAGQQMRMAV